MNSTGYPATITLLALAHLPLIAEPKTGCPVVTARSTQEAIQIEAAANKGVCPQRDPRTGRLVFTAKEGPGSSYKPLLIPLAPVPTPTMRSTGSGDAAGRWDVQCGAVPPCGVLLIWGVIGPSKPLYNLRGHKVTDPQRTTLTFAPYGSMGLGVRGQNVLQFGDSDDPLDLRRAFSLLAPGRYQALAGDMKLILLVQGDEITFHADYDAEEDPSCPGHVNQMDYLCFGRRLGR